VRNLCVARVFDEIVHPPFLVTWCLKLDSQIMGSFELGHALCFQLHQSCRANLVCTFSFGASIKEVYFKFLKNTFARVQRCI